MPEPALTPEHARALARHNLAFFARTAMQVLHPATPILWNWHLDLIANRLEDAMEGRTRRLIINIPPRYGKSLMASVTLPAFLLGRRPSAEIICASYAADLSRKMADLTRRLMNTPFYHQVFSPRLVSSRSRLGELTTPQGGFRLATSVDGTLTGRGGNVIIIDDPLNPGQAASETQRTAVNRWYDSTVPTRTNDKQRDAIIVVMQRLHEDDLVGHLLERGDWEVLSLPTIANEDEVHEIRGPLGSYTFRRKPGDLLHPERQSRADVDAEKVALGPYGFAAQHQQRPSPMGGGLIRTEWFRIYDPANPPKFVRKLQSWDTAFKEKESADYSVCLTLGETGDGQYYVLDVYRAQMGYPELKQKVREQAAVHQVNTVIIENASSGIPLAQELRLEGFARIEEFSPRGTKYERMNSCTPIIAAGKVWLPSQAYWLTNFLHEMELFPYVRHDDQVDALSQALAWCATMSGPDRWLRMMDERMRRAGCG